MFKECPLLIWYLKLQKFSQQKGGKKKAPTLGVFASFHLFPYDLLLDISGSEYSIIERSLKMLFQLGYNFHTICEFLLISKCTLSLKEIHFAGFLFHRCSEVLSVIEGDWVAFGAVPKWASTSHSARTPWTSASQSLVSSNGFHAAP